MIIEHRTYSLRPGTLDGWLKKYEAEGLPLQMHHLGRLIGVYVSEIGRLHQVVLIWAYDSLADRESRRTALTEDPRWQAYMASMWTLDAIEAQDVMVMNPASFSPPIAV